MTSLVDMSGAVFEGIEVLRRGGHIGARPAWECRCRCGATYRATGASLRRRGSTGCETCAAARKAAFATTHGGVGTREYVTYCAMKQRCNDPNNKRFPRYGGRGIRVCDRWAESFAAFLADMGPKPTPRHSIERADTDGNYEPGNCSWATKEAQANNKSNNTRIEIDGRTQNLTQWAREFGVHRTVILRRMQRGLSGAALINKGT